MKQFLLKICYFITEPTFFKNPLKKYDLVMLDNIYPNPISGFRYAEFTAYLKYYNNSKIIVNPTAYQYLNLPIKQFNSDLKNFRKTESHLGKKVYEMKNISNINTKLFYCVFYGIIAGKVKQLNELKIPFVFTLYPGGGFNLKDPKVLENLKMICKSEFFKGVITTQKITVDYLLNHNICTPDKITYIFGGIVPQYSINTERTFFYKHSKQNLDVCFCAAKYMEGGLDKGYDIFIQTAKLICETYSEARFHVIGGFNDKDFELGDFSSKFTFYGYKKYEELQNIFLNMDFIFSPNRPNILREGLFDGFPLGTVVEAALNGVIPLVTDELDQNDSFNKDEIFICQPTVESFFEQFNILVKQDLKEVSKVVQKKFRNLYNDATQLNQRIDLLNKHIN